MHNIEDKICNVKSITSSEVEDELDRKINLFFKVLTIKADEGQRY